MGASVVLSPDRITVTPGATATVSVRIRNDGNVVDVFSIDMVGETAAWATITPATLNLFPGAEGTAEVRFAPPRSAAVLAGTKPFGVRVRSQEDPGFSVVDEGTVDVELFSDLGATLVPLTVETSRAATARVQLVNAGNGPADLAIRVEDPDEALTAGVDNPAIHLAPGEHGVARLSLRPRERFLRGPQRSRPYSVVIDHGGAAPIKATGTLVQKPVIAATWVRAAAGLGVVALAAVLFVATRSDKTPPPSGAGSNNPSLANNGLPTLPGGGTMLPSSTMMATSTTTAETKDRPILYEGPRNGTSSRVWAIGRDGGGVKALTADGTDAYDPALSPDGKRIAYVSTADGDGEIYVMNVDGSGRKQLTDNQVNDESPAWSPDAKRLAYVSGIPTPQVFSMKVDGSDRLQVTAHPLQTANPSWSPDGGRIAFTAYRSPNNPEVAVIDAQGSNFTYLTNEAGFDQAPSWSSSNKIAFESSRSNNNYDVWTMNPDGSDLDRLTDNANYDGQPAWSGDGKDIAFISNRSGGQYRLWSMTDDGTDESPVTQDAAADPSW